MKRRLLHRLMGPVLPALQSIASSRQLKSAGGRVSCGYTSLGVGKCQSSSCTRYDSLFEECLDEIAWPHDDCADNCSDDPSCLAYSQSVSYSSTGSGVTIYNVCIYYADDTPETSDGERWGLGKADPECMVKDNCTVITAPPSPAPSRQPSPAEGSSRTDSPRVSLIIIIVIGSIIGLIIIGCACWRIRSKFVLSDKNPGKDGPMSSFSAGTVGDTNERDREARSREGGNTFPSVFSGVGAGGAGTGGGLASGGGGGGGIFGTGAGGSEGWFGGGDGGVETSGGGEFDSGC